MKRISLVSNQNIRKHLANNSPAKITHAFTKSKRFLQNNPECKEAFYNNTTSLSKRHSGIGFGQKIDFTKNTIVSPASSTYRMKSSFEKLDKTYSFRISRQKSPQRNYLYHVTKAKVPGPGTYQNQIKTKMTISFTHRPKTIDVNKEKLSYLLSPGPGKYQSLEMSPRNGKPKLSKHNAVKLSVINKDIRFKNIKPLTPAPNHYSHIDNLSPDSRYLLSQHSGRGTRPFDRELKFTNQYWKHWQDNHNPAPAKYDRPSDFGVYGDYNYYKTLNLKD